MVMVTECIAILDVGNITCGLWKRGIYYRVHNYAFLGRLVWEPQEIAWNKAIRHRRLSLGNVYLLRKCCFWYKICWIILCIDRWRYMELTHKNALYYPGYQVTREQEILYKSLYEEHRGLAGQINLPISPDTYTRTTNPCLAPYSHKIPN